MAITVAKSKSNLPSQHQGKHYQICDSVVTVFGISYHILGPKGIIYDQNQKVRLIDPLWANLSEVIRTDTENGLKIGYLQISNRTLLNFFAEGLSVNVLKDVHENTASMLIKLVFNGTPYFTYVFEEKNLGYRYATFTADGKHLSFCPLPGNYRPSSLVETNQEEVTYIH